MLNDAKRDQQAHMQQGRRWLNFLLLASSLIPLVLVMLFMRQTNTGFPQDDDIYVLVPIAQQVAEGTFALANTVQPYGDTNHFLIPAMLITAASTWLCDLCEPFYGDVVFGFALLIWAVLGALLFRHQRRDWLALFALAAWFIFTIQQSGFSDILPYRSIWTSLAYSIRVHSVLFFLVGVLALLRGTSLWHLLLAMLMGVLASFSSAPGLAVWPVYLLLILWQHPAHKWRNLALMLLVGCMTLPPYLLRSTGSIAAERADLSAVPGFTLAVMGALPVRTLADSTITLSIVLGIVGLGGGVLLAFALSRQKRTDTLVLPVAFTLFAFIASGLTAVGRSGWQFDSELPGTYLMPTTLFWLALYMLALAFLRTKAGARRLVQLPVYGGMLLIFALNAASMLRLYAGVDVADRDALIACAQRYTIAPDVDCQDGFGAGFRWQQDNPFDALIDNRLAIFRDVPFYDLPPDMSSDASIILSRPYSEFNRALRQNYLPGFSDEQIFTFAPREVETPDALPADFMTALSASGQVWWLFDDAAIHSAIALPPLDGAAVYQQIHHEAFAGTPLQIMGFEVIDNPLPRLAELGDELQLHAASITGDTTLTVQMNWSRARAISRDYSLSLSLLDAWGNRIAGSDSGFAIPTTAWQADVIYEETRTLTLPQDLPQGRYTLGLSVYFYLNPDAPLATSDDTPRSFIPLEQIDLE